MAIIANLKKLENGSFEGKLKTLTLKERILIQPLAERSNENAPDFRVKVNRFEAGAGWNKVSDNQNDYISVQLDAPEFSAPIFANLIKKENEYLLIWSR